MSAMKGDWYELSRMAIRSGRSSVGLMLNEPGDAGDAGLALLKGGLPGWAL
jgi:hypothetical protein